MMAKQTKKEMKLYLDDLEKNLKDIKYGYKNQDEWKKLIIEKEQINKRLDEIIAQWYLDNENIELAIKEEIFELKKAIKNIGGLNPLDYSSDIQQSHKLFYRGTTSYAHRKLIWVSDDERFCLLKIPSYTGYVDRVTGSKSSPSEWFLIDSKIYEGGIFKSDKGVIYYQEGGRWSNKFQKLCKEKIESYVLENLF